MLFSDVPDGLLIVSEEPSLKLSSVVTVVAPVVQKSRLKILEASISSVILHFNLSRALDSSTSELHHLLFVLVPDLLSLHYR